MTQNPDRSKTLIAEILRVPPDSKKEAIKRLITEGERIIYAGSEGGIINPSYDKSALNQIIAQIEDASSTKLNHSYFVTAHGEDIDEHVLFLAASKPEPVGDLNKSEIEALLDAATCEDLIEHAFTFIWFLTESLGKAFGSDLIYYPYGEWTNHQLADEIDNRRQLLAEGGIDALNAYERDIATRLLADSDAKYWAVQWATGKIYPGDRPRRYEELKRRFPSSAQ